MHQSIVAYDGKLPVVLINILWCCSLDFVCQETHKNCQRYRSPDCCNKQEGCDRCRVEHQCTDETTIISAPPSLVIHVVRPGATNEYGETIIDRRQYNLTSALHITTLDGSVHQYEPAGFIRRKGMTATSGHYVYVHYLRDNTYTVTYDDTSKVIDKWDSYDWAEVQAEAVGVLCYSSDAMPPELPSFSSVRASDAAATNNGSTRKRKKPKKKKKDKAGRSIHRDGDARIRGPCITPTSGNLDFLKSKMAQDVSKVS